MTVRSTSDRAEKITGELGSPPVPFCPFCSPGSGQAWLSFVLFFHVISSPSAELLPYYRKLTLLLIKVFEIKAT